MDGFDGEFADVSVGGGEGMVGGSFRWVGAELRGSGWAEEAEDGGAEGGRDVERAAVVGDDEPGLGEEADHFGEARFGGEIEEALGVGEGGRFPGAG